MMVVKREDEIEYGDQVGGSALDFHGIFDFGGGGSFMELLGIGDPAPPMYDYPTLGNGKMVEATVTAESSETVNFPATPNSSSISSSSAEENIDAKHAIIVAAGNGDDEDVKPKLKVGAIKKGQKRTREPRFAFVTKSDVDHLDDGFRWRKYGQKAVKNSPFPRSYYRCTSASCGVKKRVERSSADPGVVVTTYEGRHTHSSPIGPRGVGHHLPPPITAASASPHLASQLPTVNMRSYPTSVFPQPMSYYPSMARIAAAADRRFANQGAEHQVMVDDGLLQDVIRTFRA